MTGSFLVIYTNSVLPQRKRITLLHKEHLANVLREIIAVFSEDHTKSIDVDKLCEQNAELENVKAYGTVHMDTTVP